ncbi:MAG: hypothetical protein AAF567_04080 [Actinomycetota bacterium]
MGDFSHPEWSRIFAWADHARAANESVVESVRAGELSLDAAHARSDADPMTARVFAVKVYEAVPGIGKVKARRTMESFGLDEDVTLGDVSSSDRQAIVDRFAEIEGVPLSEL